VQYHAYQPVQGLFFDDKQDFSGDIQKIRSVAEAIRATPMPERISVAKARLMVDRAGQVFAGFDAQVRRMLGDSSNQFVAPQIESTRTHLASEMRKKITNSLVPLLRGPTVPSRDFQRSISSFLMSVVFAFESLQFIDDAKPFLIRTMPFTVSLFVAIGRAVELASGTVFGPLKAAVDAADKSFGMMIEALKWGSIAGGLYLLYKAIEPKKGKST
jgi:hypothetical protein